MAVCRVPIYLVPALFVYYLMAGCPVSRAEQAVSILQSEPHLYALYRKPVESLSKSERWEISRHGLRLAPLDRRVWAARYLDKLDNRYLVSIRPYFLRMSEDLSVRIKEVELEFSFHPANFQQMSVQPHSHTPILEIGFAGDLQPGLPGRRLQVDRSYAARLSGHFQFHSGLLYRSHNKSVLVGKAKEPVLHVKRPYHVKLQLEQSRAVLFVDGQKFAAASGRNLDRGLLSLTVGWHPVSMKQLRIRGTKIVDGARVPFEVSGLHNIEK